ncbi:MAG TPA: metal ABC transporter substrate-binding protein [Candidatus Binatia bacterium]|nr:metal ABC transporter substrate-binding protein [Candidatus Binatia bacterium]
MRKRTSAAKVCRLALVAVSIAASRPATGFATTVVATVFPLADIVRQIADERVQVETLLPAGANPHTFEPTPEQLRMIAGAELFIRVGAGLDDWVVGLLHGSNTPAPVLSITDGIALLGPADSPHGDPHVWLDPILVRDHIVPSIVRALTQAVPAQQVAFERNAAMFADQLTELDREINTVLQPLEHRGFVAVHPAWRYFARRYRLEEVAVVEASPGREPTAQSIAAIVERARRRDVRAVLTEPQVHGRTAAAIAREIGAEVVTVDPLGGPRVPGRESYVALMRYNSWVFAEALR